MEAAAKITVVVAVVVVVLVELINNCNHLHYCKDLHNICLLL
jgi:hypothetical protein